MEAVGPSKVVCLEDDSPDNILHFIDTGVVKLVAKVEVVTDDPSSKSGTDKAFNDPKLSV